jgi:hypothetical protein
VLKDLSKCKFFDEEGSFNLAAYIYECQKELMKFTLDQGNMAINDNRKLRSYKERVKKAFYDMWFDLASILESMEIIEACGCDPKSFCKECGGSRYRLGMLLAPEEIKEVFSFVAPTEDEGLKKELEDKLPEAEKILGTLRGEKTADA